jgi:hypothetical protein
MQAVPTLSSDRRPEQARSHGDWGVADISLNTKQNCGGGLARECCVSFNIDAG